MFSTKWPCPSPDTLNCYISSELGCESSLVYTWCTHWIQHNQWPLFMRCTKEFAYQQAALSQISSLHFDTAVSLWSCVCAPSACIRCVCIGQHIAEGHHQRALPPFVLDCWWAGWARGFMSQADWGQARPRRCCHLAWKGICVCESCSGMRAAHCARYPSFGAVCWAWCCRRLAKSFVWRAQSVHLAAAA